MSAQLCLDMMKDYPPSLAATAKIKDLPENFAWYEFEWVGDFQTTDTMKVEGGVFQVAKSGKNKGLPSVLDKSTKKVVYINKAEMKKAQAKLAKAQAKTAAKANEQTTEESCHA